MCVTMIWKNLTSDIQNMADIQNMNTLENETQLSLDSSLQKALRVLTKNVVVTYTESGREETLMAGKEIALTGNIKQANGKEYAETEEGTFVERNALRRSTDVLP